MLVFLVAVIAVALFVVGLSITLMRKGRNIQGDVGDNDDMKRLGLECALKEGGLDACHDECSESEGCASCQSAKDCKLQ